MQPQPFTAPNLAPVVPRDADPKDMLLARTVNDTVGSLNQRTGQFVPAAIAKTPSLVQGLDHLAQATDVVAQASNLVPFVNLGVGVFNAVMSWKINKKLNHLTAAVDELALRQALEFHQLHESLGRIELAISESHREMEVKDLERLQYQVAEIAHAVHETEARHDAERLIEVAGQLAAHPRPNLHRLDEGAVERFPYVMARVQGMVAEADARYILAELTNQPRQAQHAAGIREQARRLVTREMGDALRENSVKELLEPHILIPVAYWHTIQGLDAGHLLTDGETIVEGQVVWDTSAVEPLRHVLTAARPTTYRSTSTKTAAEFLDDAGGWDALVAFQGITGMPDRVYVPPPREVLEFVGLHGHVAPHADSAAKVVLSYDGWLRVHQLCRASMTPEDAATLPSATLQPDPATSKTVELDWLPAIESGPQRLRDESIPSPDSWALALHQDASTVLEPSDPRLQEIAARGLLLAVEHQLLDEVPALQDIVESALESGEASLLAQLAIGRAELAQGQPQEAVLSLGCVLEHDREGSGLGAELTARKTEPERRRALIIPALQAARMSREAGVPQQFYRAVRAHKWASTADKLECRFYEELTRIETEDNPHRRGHVTKDLRRHLTRAREQSSGVPPAVIAEMQEAFDLLTRTVPAG